MAEVLITLAIIGIIAALTVPNLMQKYHKHIIETRLKKFYSMINQAIKLSEADNGDKYTWVMPDIDTFWNTYLKNYIKYEKVEPHPTLNDRKTVYFADGSKAVIEIHLDSNGGGFFYYPFKQNTSCYDAAKNKLNCYAFCFWPGESKLGAENVKYHTNKGAEPCRVWWDGNPKTLYTRSDVGCSKTSTSLKQFCAAIIQDNGWVIPKDFPLRY